VVRDLFCTRAHDVSFPGLTPTHRDAPNCATRHGVSEPVRFAISISGAAAGIPEVLAPTAVCRRLATCRIRRRPFCSPDVDAEMDLAPIRLFTR